MGNKIFTLIVALVLIFAVVGGTSVLLTQVDGSIDDLISNISGVGTETKVDDSSEESDSGLLATYYIDEVNQTGYSTVDNVTYFFKVIDLTTDEGSILRLYQSDFAKYGYYTPYVLISTDLEVWSAPEWWDDGDSYFADVYGMDTVYLCYTKMANVDAPKAVLEELNQNVFTDTNYFNYSISNYVG